MLAVLVSPGHLSAGRESALLYLSYISVRQKSVLDKSAGKITENHIIRDISNAVQITLCLNPVNIPILGTACGTTVEDVGIWPRSSKFKKIM